MITRILLDLDDVMNQCTFHALRWVKCPIDDLSYETYPKQFGYDIVTVANYLFDPENFKENPHFTVGSFWDCLPREFWSTIPNSPQFEMLLGSCEALVGQENICIATAPTIDPECAAGKTEWIQRVMPRWLQRQYQIGPRKKFFAHPEALLIDDSDENEKQFRAWGGNTLLVPRPWNTNNHRDTDAYLAERFEELFDDKSSGL